jgi:hypothetical protein
MCASPPAGERFEAGSLRPGTVHKLPFRVLLPDRKRHMSMSKQFRIAAAILVGGIVVASSACSVDSLDQTTAPRSLNPALTASHVSGRSLTGSTSAFPDMSQDGTYNVTIDPTVANTLVMAGNTLQIPAASVCAIGSSGYGPTYWNAPCAPEVRLVQLTITVNSSGSGASVDFSPALRFNPLSTVSLTLSAPNVSVQDAKNWVILYCPSSTSTTSGNGSGGSGSGKYGDKCVNESLNDKDLQTFIDYDAKQLSRRIKHFSLYTVGYTVSE